MTEGGDWYDDADLVPLGEVLEDLDKRREREAWLDEVAKARRDLERAQGKRVEDDGPIGFVDAETIMATEYGPTPWLIDGLMTERSVFVIGGEPKTAKTWVGVEMAIAVATDTPVWGEFKVRGVEGRGAWLFLCEDQDRSVKNRLRGLIAGRDPVLAGWGKRLQVKALGSMKLDDVNSVARYVATVRRGIKPAIVVFDPLRDLHGKNEDSSGEMAEVTSMLRAVRTVLDCSVAFVHHSAKATQDGAKRRGGQKLRGSSALHGAVDGGLYMTNPSREINADKRKTTMAAQVESEVKAAASAGDFALTLEVFDDSNREAVRAQWVVTRGEAQDPKEVARRERLEAQIVAALERHDMRHPEAALPLRDLRAIVGARHQLVSEACARLVAAGRLTVSAGTRGNDSYRVARAIAAAPEPPEVLGPDDDLPWT